MCEQPAWYFQNKKKKKRERKKKKEKEKRVEKVCAMSAIRDNIVDLASGTIGGLVSTVVGHPLDTVRVRLQAGSGQVGMLSCFKQTIRSEGITGLYKGVASPISGAMFHNAVLFFVYGNTVRMITGGDRPLTPREAFLAGAVTGAAAIVVETPMDLLKCKMQLQGQNPAASSYTGVYHAASSIYRNHGLRGLYQGATVNLLRNVPCFSLYFGAFELTKQALMGSDPQPSSAVLLASGAAAGLGYWASPFYFIDALKTRLQADHSDPALRRYKGVVDAFKQTVAEGGVHALYRGYLPTQLRAMIANAACFFAVMTSAQFFKETFPASRVDD